jgi:hypothetical protein
MKYLTYLLYLILVAGLFSCGSSNYNDMEDLTIKEGVYSFVMTDSINNLLFEGIFNVNNLIDNNISGTYKITKEHVEDFPGSSTMRGEFDGELSPDGKSAFVNTNPKIADANVLIRLTAGKVSYVGKWEYSTMMGVKAWGYFRAWQ